ncbi:hypothetical protein BX600DRAFT_371799, partial [Xylariales sp. PMI_506]
FLVPFLLFTSAAAVLLPFENCLPDNYIYTNQPAGEAQLQWIPLHLDAVFDLDDGNHNLRVTVWGNVTGKIGNGTLPAWNNATAWDDPNEVDGKISNRGDSSGLATTLHSKVDVATYEPYIANVNFCDNLVNGSCPLGPVFNASRYVNDLSALPSFNLSNNFDSTYAFTSFAPTFFIIYGNENGTTIGCVSATVTPGLGGIASALKFLPLMVLILVGFATVFSAIFSPWGTSDLFHWSSNYGRDPDLLRLVTPGFGDCLQYIQFIALTGGLTLDYPGFYQPAVSNVAWSSLMFNQSFVANANPWESLVDGVYVTNGTYGLEELAQLVGMGNMEDIWAGMIIWLLVIIAIVLFATQIGFLARWLWRYIKHTTEEDLRAKNLPFTVGNVIRLVFNYFLLPLVALSTFQLVIAGQSPAVLVAMATVTIALIIGFASWLMHLIITTKPRAHLFDDLPTVLLYGPLYNTYSDGAAPFALIPIILMFIRGIAIGAVQPSGIAQVVVLAVCEVIQMLTLHAFRPFHPATSMNAYHTGFALFRFLTIIPMVAFAPQMGLTEGSKDWTGYTILLLHGGVLVFGFFLNAIQTIIEVIARMYGAGNDDVLGQKRGGLSKIFGARQLQRRVSRRGATSRASQLSTAGMLDTYNASKQGYGRVRSESAGSMGVFLNNQRSSSVMDGRSVDMYSVPAGTSAFTPTTPGAEASSFSLPSPGQATRPQPAADPYYRPPRARRATNDDFASSRSELGRRSVGSIDLPSKRISLAGGQFADNHDLDGVSERVPMGPVPAQASYMPVFAPRADYSTREVDFYYRVRGPALNSDAPNRKLGTGPADPTSPVATATGWLKSIFGGKTKDKGKGFEVVRSARMPPTMRARGGDFTDDAPEGIPVAMGVLRNGPIESDDEDEPKTKPTKQPTGFSSQAEQQGEVDESHVNDAIDAESVHVSNDPPLLPDLDTGDSFKLPIDTAGPIPEVPRKSSKRHSGVDHIKGNPSFNLIPPAEAVDQPEVQRESSARLPFDRSNSQRRLSGSSLGATDDFGGQTASSAGHSGDSGDERPTSYGYVNHHNISRIDPDRQVDLLGSAAEVVNDSR